MRQEIDADYFCDEHGHPTGGQTAALGLAISWQDGPLVDPATGERREPNGCFVETVIEAALDRIRFYQRSNFHCEENDLAIDHLSLALAALGRRTRDREMRGVEGTHAP